MKKQIILLMVAFTLSSSFSQLLANDFILSSINEGGIETWTKEQCDDFLVKVDDKKAFFNSNPQEKSQAEAEGWYQQIDAEVKRVESRLEELSKGKKSKKKK